MGTPSGGQRVSIFGRAFRAQMKRVFDLNTWISQEPPSKEHGYTIYEGHTCGWTDGPSLVTMTARTRALIFILARVDRHLVHLKKL